MRELDLELERERERERERYSLLKREEKVIKQIEVVRESAR